MTLLVGIGLAAQPGADDRLAACREFQDWADRFAGRPARSFRNQEEQDRICALARERAAHWRFLMEHQPQEALRFAIPHHQRQKLPAALHPFIERPLKERGSFNVSCALAKSSAQPGADHRHGLLREVVVQGTRYEAFIFGSWRNQTSIDDTGIDGLVLGDAILLGDNPAPGQAPAPQPFDLPSPKTLLYIVARFSDEAVAPIADAAALSQMTGVSAFLANNSSGAVFIEGLANPGQPMDIAHVTLPWPRSYGSNYNNNFSQLLTDARSAASSQGYSHTDYSLDVVVTSDQNFTYAGRANIGVRGCHLVSPDTTLRTAGHELGHNLGLFHANYWRTDSVRPFGKDSVPGGYVADVLNAEWVEYGHPFSLMSAHSGAEIDDPFKPHYAPAEKARLGWLAGNQIAVATSSTTNRLFRHDHRDTIGVPRAIEVDPPATDYTAYGRRYWLNYRYAPWNTASAWFRSGLQIDVSQQSYGFDGAVMLDMTPFSADAAAPFFDPLHKPATWWTIDSSDKLDGALLVGRTYSDIDAGIHITPIATGNNGPGEEFIDVVVHLGAFTGNRPPSIAALTAETNVAGPNQAVGFAVMAADPDGDALAYSWDFDEVQVFTQSGLNSPAAAKSWPTPGQYRVTATVSDMKGGIATESMVVTVGQPPHIRQISGRVIWAGRPVYGAKISASVSGLTRQSWTDSDGFYILAGLPDTNSYALQCAADRLTFTPQFSNPVLVSGTNAFGKDFHANQPLPPGGGTPTFSVAGQVTYAGEGVRGVEIAGDGLVTVTDPLGFYQFKDFPTGTHTLLARKENWLFTPLTRTVILTSSNSAGNDFSRFAPYSISGRIDGLPAGPQADPPTVYLSNGRFVGATLQGSGSDRYWAYTLADVPPGQFSIVAELWDFNIVPAGFTNPLSISGNLENINFAATAASIDGSISGRIIERGLPLPGVLVTATRSSTNAGVAITDSDGFYIIPNLQGASFTVAPSRAGYAFSPPMRTSVFAGAAQNSFLAIGPNLPPAISTVSAAPSTVPDAQSTTTLSAAASGQGPLTFTWDATAGRGPVSFTPNDSSSAATTAVSFQVPGSYTFRVRVTDVNALTTTSTVSVIVSAAPAAMVVSPYEATIASGASLAFRADAWDELGNRITLAPAWSISGGGIISTGGLFSAASPGGPFLVTAVAGSLSATGSVRVTASIPATLQISWRDVNNGTLRIQGDGDPLRSYTLEFKNALTNTNWQALQTLPANNLGAFEFTDQPPPATTSRFYRVFAH